MNQTLRDQIEEDIKEVIGDHPDSTELLDEIMETISERIGAFIGGTYILPKIEE